MREAWIKRNSPKTKLESRNRDDFDVIEKYSYKRRWGKEKEKTF